MRSLANTWATNNLAGILISVKNLGLKFLAYKVNSSCMYTTNDSVKGFMWRLIIKEYMVRISKDQIVQKVEKSG